MAAVHQSPLDDLSPLSTNANQSFVFEAPFRRCDAAQQDASRTSSLGYDSPDLFSNLGERVLFEFLCVAVEFADAFG